MSPTGVRGDLWRGRPHASTSPTSGRPASPLRRGRHEGGTNKQSPAPGQGDRDVAPLATRLRRAVARRGRGRRLDRRGSRRASVLARIFAADLHDDRPALGIRELLTDEDLAVLVLVDGVAADLDRVLARREPLINVGRADVLAHPHSRTGGGGVAGAESATWPMAAMVAAALMDSSRRAAEMSAVVVAVVMFLPRWLRHQGQNE
jgi:hypothetical protein